jgi:hypothetical protein
MKIRRGESNEKLMKWRNINEAASKKYRSWRITKRKWRQSNQTMKGGIWRQKIN